MRREWKERKTEYSNSENPSVRPEFKSAHLEQNPLLHSIHAFKSTTSKINTYRNKAALYLCSIYIKFYQNKVCAQSEKQWKEHLKNNQTQKGKSVD